MYLKKKQRYNMAISDFHNFEFDPQKIKTFVWKIRNKIQPILKRKKNGIYGVEAGPGNVHAIVRHL